MSRLAAWLAALSARERTLVAAAATAAALALVTRGALAVRGASLADTVRLLHRLETADPPLHVARLELRKQPDDPAHFDATVEVAELHAAP